MDRLKTKLQVKSFITKKIINEINRKIGASCLLEKKNENPYQFQPTVDAGLNLTPQQESDDDYFREYAYKKSTLIPDGSLSRNEWADFMWKLQSIAPALQMIPGAGGKFGKFAKYLRPAGWAGNIINFANPAVQTGRLIKDPSTDSTISFLASLGIVPFRPQAPLPVWNGKTNLRNMAIPQLGGVPKENKAWNIDDASWGPRIHALSPTGKPPSHTSSVMGLVLSDPLDSLPRDLVRPGGPIDHRGRTELRRALRDNPDGAFMTTRNEDEIRQLLPTDPSKSGFRPAAPKQATTDPFAGVVAGAQMAGGPVGMVANSWAFLRNLWNRGQSTRARVATTPSENLTAFPLGNDEVPVRLIGREFSIRPTRITPAMKGAANSIVVPLAYSNYIPRIPETPDGYSMLANPESAFKGISPIGYEDYEHPYPEGIEIPPNPDRFIPRDIPFYDRMTWSMKTSPEKLKILKHHSNSEEVEDKRAKEIFTDSEIAKQYFEGR